ncbi:uncharacterized protein EV422DRAFT_567798 [Fimicolochytrium jonesii]|uniref:uncharacterized protein n=1 Tax=Fimicolochytrium jonesii TaxID=1396493 RepID=UPI0022FF2264|nr:uncharacterized protein EV422DRAFT_567798 [Fimicolochytrium jonesii]KAI8820368.1 hypothetical protein EV422DRAFT_567798 [Fimicolochytrium jonesii]
MPCPARPPLPRLRPAAGLHHLHRHPPPPSHFPTLSFLYPPPFTHPLHTTAHPRATSSTFCPYQTLHIPASATRAQIKKAYYKTVFELHPDRLAVAGTAGTSSTDPTAPRTKARVSARAETNEKEEFLRAVRAYEILSDPEKRRQWDGGVRAPFIYESSTSSSPRGSQSQGGRPFSRGGGSGGGNPFSSNPFDSNYTPPHWSTANDPDFPFAHSHPAGNTTPLYMSNGRLAALIVLAAILSGTLVVLQVNSVRRNMRRRLDDQDRELRGFYEERLRRARENGFERQTEPLRRRAREVEFAERALAAEAAGGDGTCGGTNGVVVLGTDPVGTGPTSFKLES